MSDDDEGMPVEWVDELDIDELINDDHEYQFNTQVDDELEMYMQDEGIDSVESGERMKAGAANAAATDSVVKEDKRQTCPDEKEENNNSDTVGRVNTKTDGETIRAAWGNIDTCGLGRKSCRISTALVL